MMECCALLMIAGSCLGAPKQTPPKYVLPTAAATTWRALVFAAYVPAAQRSRSVPYTVQVRMTVNGEAKESELKGEVVWRRIAEHELAVPAGCESVELVLRWPAEHRLCDLDVGLEQKEQRLRLAPLFTTLQPERLIYDAQSAGFFEGLSKMWPEWSTGYPFWAEIRSARPASGGGAR